MNVGKDAFQLVYICFCHLLEETKRQAVFDADLG
jgi:hypothetical protein